MTKEKDLTFQGEIQRLKKTINIQAKDYIELKQENEKLKEENVKLLFGKGALIKLCDNLTKIIDEKKEKESKLWQTLEEINLILDELKQQYDYMADYSEIKEIQEKIIEVLS